MKKDYRKITLEKGITINEMVFYLMEYASRGEFVCVEYEGHKFYSDTISMNSAYQKVYGKSYYEIMADGQDASEDVETPVASVEETVAEVAETTVKVEEVAVETTEETAEETAEEVVAETTAEDRKSVV